MVTESAVRTIVEDMETRLAAYVEDAAGLGKGREDAWMVLRGVFRAVRKKLDIGQVPMSVTYGWARLEFVSRRSTVFREDGLTYATGILSVIWNPGITSLVDIRSNK